MSKPDPNAIADAGNVTPAFARMLIAGTRKPSLPVALAIYDGTGWRFGQLDGLNPSEIDVLRKVAA